MIPQKIHYCWLSKAAKPRAIKEVMKSWGDRLPGYEMVNWDAEKYMAIPDKPKYVEDAYEQGKWAFVCDFVRAWALWSEGGWYFDCDLQILRDDLTEAGQKYRFVSAVEVDEHPLFGENRDPRVQLQAAFLGSEKGHPYMGDIVNYYKVADFKYDGGNTIIAPTIYAEAAEKYGFKYSRDEQDLDGGGHLFSASQVLAHMKYMGNPNEPFAIHHCLHSWCQGFWGVDVNDVILMSKLTEK